MMPKNAVWMVLIISIFFLASVSAVFAAPIGCRFHCEDSGGFIGGIKINDLNGNGMQDHGEPGLQGWEITLTGPVTASRITDASGFYNFHDLPDGTYRICEVRQSGWEQTYPNAGLSCAGGTKGYTITINNGESFYHVDFRNTAVHLGSVSGMKFDDINMDGHWQAGEPRLQDWTIKLTGHHEATAITDSHGDYHFHDLPDETYIVCEIPQAGWQQISPSSGPSCTAGSKGYNVTVANGNAIEHKDFGNAHKQKGSISGYKWEDINHNMQEDPGEGRLPDWTIFLDQDNDDILDSGEPSTITDLNGHFIFSNLMPGTYYVREVLKEGWIQITPNPDPIVVTDGEQITGIKFGNQNVSATIIIRGIKFNDLNGNGAKDAGEPGLQGWNIFLDENGNNQFDAGEMSAVTDAGGNYEFKNLIPGTYIVREVQQPGWQQTTQNPAPINAEPGNIYDNINFGNKHLPTNEIQGVKFKDLDGDGVKDANEPGIFGWKINLYAGNNILTTTSTDGSGMYAFTGLEDGSYVVCEVLQQSWQQTAPATGVSCPDNSFGYEVNLQNGNSSANKDFGNRPFLARISGYKWEDSNGNMVQDSGEPRLQGWTIFLDQDGDNTLDPGERSTATNSNGEYVFVSIPPGTYSAREVQQSGWTQTTPNPVPIIITDGEQIQNVSFGNQKIVLLNSISGMKFKDIDGDGYKDWFETGIFGWLIFLDEDNDNLPDSGELSTRTDANGNYMFSNLPGGTYLVREEQRSGWLQTTPNPGPIVLDGDDHITEIDFGNKPLFGRISGTKFKDLNGNGVKDSNEPVLAGWTIMLGGHSSATKTTDANGNYMFTNLASGDYTVCEVQQPGWQQTYPTPGFACPDGTSGYTVTIANGLNAIARNFGNMPV